MGMVPKNQNLRFIVPTWQRTWFAMWCIGIISCAIAIVAISCAVANANPGSETSVTNTARFASDLQISLVEPHWQVNSKNIGDQNSSQTDAFFAVPNVPIPKDPQAINTSSIDSWIFLTVNIPLVSARKSLGQSAEQACVQPLFDANFNSKYWHPIEAKRTEDFDILTFGSAAPARPNDITEPLFTEIVMRDLIDGDISEAGIQNVTVTATGIQASGLDSARAAWDALQAQLEKSKKDSAQRGVENLVVANEEDPWTGILTS